MLNEPDRRFLNIPEVPPLCDEAQVPDKWIREEFLRYGKFLSSGSDVALAHVPTFQPIRPPSFQNKAIVLET